MINSVKIPTAYSEVYSFINALGSDFINKIPTKLYTTIKENRDMNYNPVFHATQTLDSSMLTNEALSLISAINMQYWCNNDVEKQELKQIYIENTKREEKKYSYENLFKNREKSQSLNNNDNISQAVSENLSLTEYKESIFKRLINKIKRFFHFI
jgi:hypothetical protein